MSSELTADTVRLPSRVLYPERDDTPPHWLDRVAVAAAGIVVTRASQLRAHRLVRIVGLADQHNAALQAMDEAGWRNWLAALRRALRRDGFADRAVGRSFAAIREVAQRTIGMRHFDVQLVGGFAMLRGAVAEMDTGEGKTLTATLPAVTAALAGVPVHIVTVNDYLAARDAAEMAPVYAALGLTVGVIVEGMEPGARRAAYLCDVTYCSNKEIAFDYLRDRMTLGAKPGNLRLKFEQLAGAGARTNRLVMRGLTFAIVDEADSVLVDEARTPLIISGQTEADNEQRMAEQALELVAPLEPGADYTLRQDERLVELTEPGKAQLRALAAPMGGIWDGTILREEMARNALAAIHLFQRGEHYLVRDDKVQIVDEYTGRIMADRSWSEGLHQLVEVKEGCPATGRRVPLARMTHQRFFRRYKHLAGMSGTARGVAGELWSAYRLPVVRVPTNRPIRRVSLPDRIYPTAAQKWQAITAQAAAMVEQGRPVLLGTRSVAASQQASEYLTRARVAHCVLSAAQDDDEAQIIAAAGAPGQVTIATNMAGRGTDIKLAAGVAALGGLHVIVSERHDARRIDYQLGGRAGRQGDPGSVEAMLSLEDQLIEVYRSRPAGRVVGFVLTRFGSRRLFDRAQRKAERLHSRIRRNLLRADEKYGTMLAFSGRME